MIEKTAIETGQPEDVIEKIIDFQHRDSMPFFKGGNHVDYLGFGRFMFNARKCRLKLQHVEDILKALNKRLEKGTQDGIKGFDKKLAYTIKIRDYLKRLLNED